MIVPQDNEKCAEAIVNIIKNKELREYLINNTYREDYSNKEEIQKLYALIGEK